MPLSRQTSFDQRIAEIEYLIADYDPRLIVVVVANFHFRASAELRLRAFSHT
jgi:hypothetical protein